MTNYETCVIYHPAGWVGYVTDGERNLFVSRPCRLEVQARRLAQDWIDAETGKQPGGITLNVQNVVIDPDIIFGRR